MLGRFLWGCYSFPDVNIVFAASVVCGVVLPQLTQVGAWSGILDIPWLYARHCISRSMMDVGSFWSRVQNSGRGSIEKVPNFCRIPLLY